MVYETLNFKTQNIYPRHQSFAESYSEVVSACPSSLSPSYSFFCRSSLSTIHFMRLEFLLSQVLDWIVTCLLPHKQTLSKTPDG